MPGNCKWMTSFFLLLSLFSLVNVLLHYNTTGGKCHHHHYSSSIFIVIIPFNIIFHHHAKKGDVNNQRNRPPPACQMGILVRYEYNRISTYSTIKNTIKRSNTWQHYRKNNQSVSSNNTIFYFGWREINDLRTMKRGQL